MSRHMVKLAAAFGFIGMTMCGVATPSAAADLARQSQIGAIFAEPPLRATRVVPDAPSRDAALVIVEAIYPVQPRLPGYYGQPRDFNYRNYYGTSPVTIFSRLPYACGFVASC